MMKCRLKSTATNGGWRDSISANDLFNNLTEVLKGYKLEPQEMHFSQRGVKQWEYDHRNVVIYFTYKTHGLYLECGCLNNWFATVNFGPYPYHNPGGSNGKIIDDIAVALGGRTEPLKIEYVDKKWEEILKTEPSKVKID